MNSGDGANRIVPFLSRVIAPPPAIALVVRPAALRVKTAAAATHVDFFMFPLLSE